MSGACIVFPVRLGPVFMNCCADWGSLTGMVCAMERRKGRGCREGGRGRAKDGRWGWVESTGKTLDNAFETDWTNQSGRMNRHLMDWGIKTE